MGEGVAAVRGEQDQVGAQGGPRGVVGEAVDDPVCAGVEAGDRGSSEVVFGGDVERVDVPGGGVGQAGGGVGLLSAASWMAESGGVVAGEDPLQQVGGGVPGGGSRGG